MSGDTITVSKIAVPAVRSQKLLRYSNQRLAILVIVGDLNETGRVCGGCAVYVISIARGGRMWAATVFSADFAARRGGSGSEIGSRSISE